MKKGYTAGMKFVTSSRSEALELLVLLRSAGNAAKMVKRVTSGVYTKPGRGLTSFENVEFVVTY